MSDEPPKDDSPDLSWREPLLVFGSVVVLLFALSTLSWVWAPFANYLLLAAAAVFIAVPYFILRHYGADFHRFGIDLEHLPLKHIGLGLLVTCVVLPFFAVGHHIWEVSVQERDFQPDIDNYRQWDVELQAPSLVADNSPAIQLRTAANRLHLEWHDTGPPETTILVHGDHSFRWSLRGDLFAMPADAKWFDDPRTIDTPIRSRGVDLHPNDRWMIGPSAPDATGRLTLSPTDQLGPAQVPNRLTLDIVNHGDLQQTHLLVGTSPHRADEPIELRRTHWWLLLWALTHLLLVALPEEYFYRGYLQTRFGDLFGHDNPRTFLGFRWANWLTSVFFALGHVLIPIGGTFSLARASVFFPSLIFGWLRERTGSIVAPVVFHAGANMMVLLVGVHYF